MMDICTAGALSTDFSDFLTTTIFPLAAIAAITTGMIIGVSFLLGKLLNNPKLTLWSKTEILQVLISLGVVVFLGTTINTFCAIDLGDVANIFEVPVSATDPPDSIYDAAETYLVEAALYSHNSMSVVRYHLKAYTILSYLSVFSCGPLRCLFGYSGTNTQPFGGFGAYMAAMNIFFNSTLMAHITVLSYLFLLMFIYRGFVFLFLPMGIFLRSMPYLRGFGALLMSLAICFLLVYPLMLSILYLMGDVLVDRPDYAPDSTLMNDYVRNERIFYDRGGTNSAATGWGLAASMWLSMPGGEETFEESYLPGGGKPTEAIMFAASAFIAAFFMPTVALLATIASVSYVARLMGEEIDLSRITRMV
ncbi:MAG: hypothetical protein ABIH29_01010 [Candidatus Micrarchaeota archaeon]